MESMSQAPYLLPKARFGARMGDMKALDAMVQDGLRNPFSGKQMFEEATEVGEQLEMTRADLDKWALRSHERTIAATDDGRLPEEIVTVTVKGRKGDTVVEVDEAPRRDCLARGALQAARPRPQGGLAHGRQLAGRQRRRRRARLRLRRVGRARGQGGAGHDHRPGGGGRRVRVARPHPGQRGAEGARQGRPAAGRHRPVGDQRGVRLGHAELGQDARHRRGPRERQRRRGGDRASDRGLGRAHPRHAGARAAPARRRLRLRGDLLRRRPGRRSDRPGL